MVNVWINRLTKRSYVVSFIQYRINLYRVQWNAKGVIYIQINAKCFSLTFYFVKLVSLYSVRLFYHSLENSLFKQINKLNDKRKNTERRNWTVVRFKRIIQSKTDTEKYIFSYVNLKYNPMYNHLKFDTCAAHCWSWFSLWLLFLKVYLKVAL